MRGSQAGFVLGALSRLRSAGRVLPSLCLPRLMTCLVEGESLVSLKPRGRRGWRWGWRRDGRRSSRAAPLLRHAALARRPWRRREPFGSRIAESAARDSTLSGLGGVFDAWTQGSSCLAGLDYSIPSGLPCVARRGRRSLQKPQARLPALQPQIAVSHMGINPWFA